ncbi:MAG: hypothetical protein ACOCXQ_00855 [Patescibacteria group bacterium]
MSNGANAEEHVNKIVLSEVTGYLIKAVEQIEGQQHIDDFSRLTVSRAVSFVALMYEKVRNAIEYREEHLIRRAAIERILRRRLSMNPEGNGEGENLLRELLWARYFPKDSLGEDDVKRIQQIIDRYLAIKQQVMRSVKDDHGYYYDFLIDMLSCEIEEALNPQVSAREATYTNFIFQTLHNKIQVDGISNDQKDLYLLIAIEKKYRKSYQPYQRYHTFILFHEPIGDMDEDSLTDLIPQLPSIFKKIDETRNQKLVDKLAKFTKKQLPPYLILFDILNDNPHQLRQVLMDKQTLWNYVQTKCNDKYSQVKKRLTTLAIRSLIYIFITKIILALVLEFPVSILIYGEAQTLPIIINSLFPPVLMVMIVLWFRLPGYDNTVRIYHRIINIINSDTSFENKVNLNASKQNSRNAALRSIFSFVYILTFFITLSLIYYILKLLDFHLLSIALFIFFISVVSFFAYRIKQVVNEYRLVERDSLLTPILDFFFLPILSLGKIFSSGVTKLNFFTILFDFIIEAPFKMIIEVVEEWLRFIRARKDDII